MKLAAALTVPLLGLLLVTVIEVVDTAGDADDVRRQTALARASIGPAGLLTSLQNERTWAVVELIGQETMVQPPVVGYEESRAATDQAVTAFRATLGEEGDSAADVYRAPLANLVELTALRDRIDARTAPRDIGNIEFSDEVFAGYAELIRPFLDANTEVALAVDDAELRHATSLVDTTTRQIETLSELARTVSLEIAVGNGVDEPDEIAAVAEIKSSFDAANDELRAAAAPFDEVVAPVFPEALATDFSAQLDAAMAGETVELATVLGTLDVPAEGGYIAVRSELVDALNDRADALNQEAQDRERLYIALAVLTLALALALSWLVSRSITRPLRSLTRQAKDMAERRLPDAVNDILETPLGENIAVPRVDPVHVRTSDEVSDVAFALNTVQDTALDLAVEQAVLRRNIADSFVNLGRRNQNLLGRQLDFITELETNETDADTLANLFRLDHLATRMRRNAESLLVLAGIEPPRQWAAPVRLTDVIRAALGEVEDYQRVTVRGVEPATILGSAAADLAHLLAELIENALVFSPPDQTVDIRGRTRDDGGYTLAVIDNGLGMPPADIDAANRRLAGAESFTIAPSKYLGHYVAGNLAARHDIHVQLENSPGNGITATIDIPPSLLTTDTALAQSDEPHAAREVWPPAPAVEAPPAPVPPVDRTQATGPRPASTPAPAPTAPGGPPPWTPTGPPPAPVPDPRPRSVAPSAVAPPPPLPVPVAPSDGDPARRTSSGLVKRTPRIIDTGEVRAVGRPADGDLLDALSHYTSRPGARGDAAAPPARPPAPPSAPPAPPIVGAAPPGPAALPGRGGPRHSGPGNGDPGNGGGVTGAGLPRRVRGAQLPATTPISLRRGGATGDGSAQPPVERSRPQPGPVPPDDSIFDFLSKFTAGVQRGLDAGPPPSDGSPPAV
jgi:signal transduction histidine kinase